MRQDAKTLLDRLDRHHLNYQDFTAAAEEIELWPLFQALLRDPRIVGNREQTPAPAAAFTAQTASSLPQDVVREVSAPQPAAPQASMHPAASLFARYGHEPEAPPKPPEPLREPDLRNFLHQIGKGAA